MATYAAALNEPVHLAAVRDPKPAVIVNQQTASSVPQVTQSGTRIIRR